MQIHVYKHTDIAYDISMFVKAVKQVSASKIIDTLIKENNGVLRTVDAVNAGLSRTTLGLLTKTGRLERIAQGLYIRPDDMPDELFMLQQRSKKVVFSHETALFLHDMAERTPLGHSLTVPSSYKLSRALSEGCKIYYIKAELHSLGLCSVKSKMGNEVTAYNAERTICDILRSRSRIDGQTLAAAMKSYSVRKNQDWNKLREYADLFRVTKLLRQYLEVLT